MNELYVAKLIKDLDDLKGMFGAVFEKMEAEKSASTQKKAA